MVKCPYVRRQITVGVPRRSDRHVCVLCGVNVAGFPYHTGGTVPEDVASAYRLGGLRAASDLVLATPPTSPPHPVWGPLRVRMELLETYRESS